MASPVDSGTQVTAAISLNQICQAASGKGLGERKPVRPRLAQRVKSRRALLHVLYPVRPNTSQTRRSRG